MRARGSHAAARTRLRRRAPRLAALTSLVVAVGVLGIPPVDAASEKLLQNVDVRVAGDGTVTSIDSTLLRATGDAMPVAEEKTHDPAATAAELPVRVLTSYRMGERAGTDLSDIEGESGRVVIDVTVQNTTVRPEQIEASSGGRTTTSTALVGVPLTVVGGVTLGEDALGTVVTDLDDTADVTNGIVSRSGGDTRVQWSTFLAPPRMAASATFRLVQDVEDFTVPTFDLSVQPGLVTDTSVDRLLDTVFGGGAGSVQDLDLRTVMLLDDVTATIDQASSALDDVQSTLDGARRGLGQQTIVQLRDGQQRISTDLADLVTELEGLQDDSEQTFTDSGDAIIGDVGTTIDRVLGLLGDPSAILAGSTPDTTTGPDGCAVDVVVGRGGDTVFGQLNAVSAHLAAIARSTDRCRDSIVNRLQRLLVSSGDGEGRVSIQERLTQLSGDLTSERTRVLDVRTTLKENIAAATAGTLHGVVDQLGSDLEALRALAADANSSEETGPLPRLRERLEALQTDLGELGEATDPDSELADALASMRTTALDQAEVLEGSDSVTAQIDDAAAALCGLTLTDDADIATRDAAIGELTGSDCAGTTPTAGSAVERIATAADAFRDIADQADQVDPAGGGSGLLPVLNRILEALGAEVTRILGVFFGPSGLVDGALADLSDALTGVEDGITAVVGTPGADPQPSDEETCAVPVTEDAELVRLRAAVATIDCRQDNIGEDVDVLLASSAGGARPAVAEVLQTSAAGLAGYGADLQNLSDGLSTDIGDRFDAVGESLGSAQEEATCVSGRRIEELREQLGETEPAGAGRGERICGEQVDQVDQDATRRATAEGRITASVARALSLLGGRITASNGETDRTRLQLVELLGTVLTRIGDPNAPGGTGLLGIIGDQVANTADQNERILGAAEDAGSFRSIRQQSLLGLAKEQEIRDRSLELTEEFGVFDVDVAEASTHRVVFTFHVGGGA